MEGNMNKLCDTMKKLAGKRRKLEKPVKDKEGKPITEVQEWRNRWVEHLEELSDGPASLNPQDIEAVYTDIPIDVAHQRWKKSGWPVIGQIESGSAAGPDNIPAEALKSDMEATTNLLHVLFRKIWEEEQVPLTDWKEG
ncbi:unnamed protein product [Schistosoma mattheei]|uniref:Uncharacterized protein n=1 Tax=Schistosoma mattheei TaxID=31246 RepID=A0A183NR80_9TREM|nr:unnamed protein product [Schistosoma mattheei]